MGQEVALMPEIRKEEGEALTVFSGLKGSWAWPRAGLQGRTSSPVSSAGQAVSQRGDGAHSALARPGSEFFLYWCQVQPPPSHQPCPIQARAPGQ